MFSKIIKWFTKEKKKEESFEEDHTTDLEEREFKTFAETYRMISFALCTCLMYPNPSTKLFRIVAICLVVASVLPLAMLFIADIYKCMLRSDIIEIIRHSTMIGPFLGGFLKMLFMLWNQDSAYAIFTEINRDYALYNNASDEHKNIVRKSIRNNLTYSEKCWTVTVVTVVASFPAMAAGLTLYNYLSKWEPQRYMIHELNNPWSKDPAARWESPYYEAANAYMLYGAIFYVLNFLGYDGFYGLAINHACLKTNLYCKALEEAMKQEPHKIRRHVVCVIEEQNRTFTYMAQIQDCFNMWLGVVFLATLIQLCNLLYHISEGYGFDVRYMIFIAGVTIHTYLPCHYSAKLKATSQEVGTHFYCCGWEAVHDEGIRKMVLFMIARSQRPQEITAFNMLTFDMALFVSILQTSYSMYTLLSS